MKIDLSLMDEYEDYSEEAEDALLEFSEALIEQFFESPEGESLLAEFPDAGFWSATLLEYGYQYEGLTVSQMTADDVGDLLSNLFPRKITLGTRKDAEDAMPELKAFWHYLKRDYNLKQADQVIKCLDEIAPHFADMMFDESKAGMAKSMMMAGQESGFDMSNPDELNKFMQLHSMQQLQELANEPRSSSGGPWSPFGLPDRSAKPRVDKAKKNKRKLAKASKKKNRKKKRK